jgi:hypothetical protein
LATARRAGLVLVCAGIAAMWVYGLAFAPKEAINKVLDSEWAPRAQLICERAATERSALAELVRIDKNDQEQLNRKADIIDLATNTLERAVDEIETMPPTDDKGRAIVPMWIADYRSYIEDRRDYAEDFRRGIAGSFAETAVEGVPISERLTTFAQDNRMLACAPPIDLSA